jgi:predicted dehydrogenase
MSDNLKDKVLLVGPGNIGYDYVNVLKSFSVDIDVVGRSEKSSKKFSDTTNLPVYSGGVESYLNKNQLPKYAIVAVNEHQLCNVTLTLLKYGVKNILIEKPAGLSLTELNKIKSNMSDDCRVYVGYNRRFYRSVEECRKFIEINEEPISVKFEFTEWVHDIDFHHYTKSELERFFLCNSSHVVDLVFHLFGTPKKLNSHTDGKLDWHTPSIFIGSGVTTKDVSFSYNTNWSSSGRWGIEILFSGFKLILRPLEKLYIQYVGSLQPEEVELDGNLDTDYKPGLHEEIKSFFTENNRYLCSIEEQINSFQWYYKITGYKD